MRVILAGLLLLAAAPAAESNSLRAQCRNRCQAGYKACLKNASTSKLRALCKVGRTSCDGTCGK